MDYNVLEGINRHPEVADMFIILLEKSHQTKFSQEEKLAARLSLLELAKEKSQEIVPLDVYERWHNSILLEPLAKIIKKYMSL